MSATPNFRLFTSYDGGTTLFEWSQDHVVGSPITLPGSILPPIADRKLGTIVPLYTPPNHSSWVQLAGIAKHYPRVHTVAVIKPTGAAQDPNYVNGIRMLRNNAVTVIGYVATDKGKKSIESVKVQIDNWKSWYPDLDGIFFDEMYNVPGRETYYYSLNAYVKDKGMKFTVGNAGAPQIPTYFDTGIDTIVIYENQGYPSVASLMQPWMSKLTRSRFAVLPYGVPAEGRRARDFTGLVAGVDRIVGYVYNQTDSLPEPWDTLSPVFEATMQELDRVAAAEGMPQGAAPPTTTEPPPVAGTGQKAVTRTQDKFGIDMLYPTTGRTWFIDMDNPKSDLHFRNLPKINKQSDGSLRTSAKQVRMEAWSNDNDKWLNVEITGYHKLVTGTPTYIVQPFCRGGHHYSDTAKSCEGSAYKSRLFRDGRVAVVKEVNHPAYTNNRGVVQFTTQALAKKWIGLKTAIYNYQESGNPKTFVKIEVWVDDNCTDAEGNLVLRNDWRRVSVVRDTGGWATTNTDFNASCPHLNTDRKTGYRLSDEILNLPGGTALANVVGWRTDTATVDHKYLSAREIQPTEND